MLVEGEVARLGIARRQAPFWRRLATFAHAALLEREVLASGVGSRSLVEWALRGGGGLCGIQSSVDLRLEPRWFPQFIAPEQLRAEFLGRIATAAERHREKVRGHQIGALFWGADSVFRPENLPLESRLPGPLKGGLEAAVEYPLELDSDLRGQLQGDEVSMAVLSGLVNPSLVFRPSRQLSALAADALARVGCQVRELSDTGDMVGLVMGLAMVSAVARCPALAEQVWNLCRVARARGGESPELGVVVRVALVSAAANADFGAWSRVVGDRLAELAFADMTTDEAVALRRELQATLQVEPRLWETCGRAEAALSAFLRCVSDGADGGAHTEGGS